MKKYNLVYKVVNVVTQEYYIGVHSTNDKDDNYLGSGDRIKSSIKKHGRHIFKKYILCECDTRNEAFGMERMIVNDDVIKDVSCLNIVRGGRGDYREGIKQSIESNLKRSMTQKGKIGYFFGKKQTKESNLKRSMTQKGRPAHNKGKPISDSHRAKLKGKPAHNKGIPMSDEQKRILSTSNNFRKKKVNADGIIYNSAKEAREALGVPKSTLYNRIKSKHHSWFYITEDEDDQL